MDLFINENYIKTLNEFESFGELALLHGAFRSGSVKAKSDCYLWCLERSKFRDIIDYVNKKNYEENLKFLESIFILSKIFSYIK